MLFPQKTKDGNAKIAKIRKYTKKMKGLEEISEKNGSHRS